LKNIRVFNIDIAPNGVVGIFAESGMPEGPWNIYFAGDNDHMTRLYIVDSDDPTSARFPFMGIWITDGSEIYILNANPKDSTTLQVLFTPVISEQTAPTQETESA
jgi:hypothetical protein